MNVILITQNEFLRRFCCNILQSIKLLDFFPFNTILKCLKGIFKSQKSFKDDTKSKITLINEY